MIAVPLYPMGAFAYCTMPREESCKLHRLDVL